MVKNLAINGGDSISSRVWPKWPPNSLASNKAMEEVLTSHRWTIRGWYTGKEAIQRAFARQYAEFCKSSYCTLTSSGSTALLVGLEALGIGAHDEVIVPVYTWIASAIAVLNVNAVPVFVDVDPNTGCIDPSAVEAAITSRTKAIMPVHLHCTVADMQSLQSIAKKHGLAIIEDCAQAHGATYDGKSVGTFGDIGAFSFNQEKVLCSGEGGAIVTNDLGLYEKATKSHADGAKLPPSEYPLVVGYYELVEENDYIGSNYCMSDFQAAVLFHELEQLKERNQKRLTAANYIVSQLEKIPGLQAVPTSPNTTSRTYFRFALRRDPKAFAGVPTKRLCEALSAELRFPINQTECQPLHQNPLYQPTTKRRYHLNETYLKKIDVSSLSFPSAESHYDTTMVFHHSVLLAETDALDEIVAAFWKLDKYSHEL